MNIKNILKLFVREYLANHIVCYIPSNRFRIFFYRNFLNIDVSYSNSFQMGCYIYNSNGILKIGTNSIINRNTVLDRRGGIVIGDNVNISPDVNLYTAYHDLQDTNFSNVLNKITIDDYVVILTGSSVMPGVHMGEGSVLYPFSVLTSNTIKYGIYAGNPAKLIGYRNNELKYDPTWNSKFL